MVCCFPSLPPLALSFRLSSSAFDPFIWNSDEHPRCNTFYVAFNIKKSMNIFGWVKECEIFNGLFFIKDSLFFLLFYYARDKREKPST